MNDTRAILFVASGYDGIDLYWYDDNYSCLVCCGWIETEKELDDYREQEGFDTVIWLETDADLDLTTGEQFSLPVFLADK